MSNIYLKKCSYQYKAANWYYHPPKKITVSLKKSQWSVLGDFQKYRIVPLLQDDI